MKFNSIAALMIGMRKVSVREKEKTLIV